MLAGDDVGGLGTHGLYLWTRRVNAGSVVLETVREGVGDGRNSLPELQRRTVLLGRGRAWELRWFLGSGKATTVCRRTRLS